MRPDVLIVGDVASVHVRRLAAGLRDRDVRVEVAGFEGDELESVPIHRLGSLPVVADRRYALAIPGLARILRARRPRVVNAHYLTSYGVMSALAMRLAFPFADRPPLVQSTWGDDLLVTPKQSLLHRRFAAFALRSAALVTGDSGDLEAAARQLDPHLAWQALIFGPPAQLLSAGADRQKIILSARQLVSEMRVDLILEAFRRASASPAFQGWKLVIAGSGPEAAALRRQSAEMVNVEFVGMLPQGDLHVLMLRSSVGVSVPVSDATSATLLESLAARIVPIVNDLPANREWIDEAIGEVVARDPTADDLAGAMVRAASRSVDPRLLTERVASATWEAQVDAFAATIGRLAESGRPN
jgi:glycosyltransferase involved in cell wall biosynthesis